MFVRHDGLFLRVTFKYIMASKVSSEPVPWGVLLKNKTGSCGTVKVNRKNMPTFDLKKRSKVSSKCKAMETFVQLNGTIKGM